MAASPWACRLHAVTLVGWRLTLVLAEHLHPQRFLVRLLSDSPKGIILPREGQGAVCSAQRGVRELFHSHLHGRTWLELDLRAPDSSCALRTFSFPRLTSVILGGKRG